MVITEDDLRMGMDEITGYLDSQRVDYTEGDIRLLLTAGEMDKAEEWMKEAPDESAGVWPARPAGSRSPIPPANWSRSRAHKKLPERLGLPGGYFTR